MYAAVVALLLAGCGAPSTPTPTAPPTASPAATAPIAIAAPAAAPTLVPGTARAPLAASPAIASPLTGERQLFQVTGTEGAGVQLRQTPGGAALAVYREGTPLVQLGPDTAVAGVPWRHVRTPEGHEGWVAAEYTAPVPAAAPVRLVIPAIGVDAAVEPVGLMADGTMGTPPGPWTVGWYRLGPPPGAVGNATINGHVDFRGVGPAVFWELRHLAPGDRLTVLGADGVTRLFRVSAVEAYPADAVPLERVFGASGEPRLNLVTCAGRYDPAAQDYEERLVVYSEAVD